MSRIVDRENLTRPDEFRAMNAEHLGELGRLPFAELWADARDRRAPTWWMLSCRAELARREALS